MILDSQQLRQLWTIPPLCVKLEWWLQIRLWKRSWLWSRTSKSRSHPNTWQRESCKSRYHWRHCMPSKQGRCMEERQSELMLLNWLKSVQKQIYRSNMLLQLLLSDLNPALLTLHLRLPLSYTICFNVLLDLDAQAFAEGNRFDWLHMMINHQKRLAIRCFPSFCFKKIPKPFIWLQNHYY